MKGIIIYKSNYGSTREYAQWLQEETGFKALDFRKVKSNELTNAETIVIGCPIFANRPLLAKWIEKKWDILKNKKIALYTTSGAKANTPELKKGFQESFKPEISSKIKYFPQGGRMVISKLNFLHRMLMKLGQKMEKDPIIREEMGKDKDHVDRKGLKALIEYLK
ncbi:MAG: hypothetical protein JXR70_10340 [Spirochaetales bacterium]|nr:hypothetical protein [Spirochaetales bacterium]